MSPTPRWFTDNPADHSRRYAAHFRRLAADGADLDGEARFVDALLPRAARVLDAGCGGGRTGAALHARGHQVVGVDADAELVAAAREDHPGPTWVVRDLTALGPVCGTPDVLEQWGDVDAVVLAGNVMVFLAPGTEQAVLQGLTALLRPDGVLVAGFATDREYRIRDFDADCTAAGWVSSTASRPGTCGRGPTTLPGR